MKYMVEFEFSASEGKEIEKKPGGPGPLIGRISEAFKPSATFVAVDSRRIYFVCDLDPAAMGTLMVVGSNATGQTPKFTPIVAGQDFGGIAGTIMETAAKILS